MRRTTRLQRQTFMVLLIAIMLIAAMLIAAAWRAFGPDQPPRVGVEARDPLDAERWRN